jgi:hypothetical protein
MAVAAVAVLVEMAVAAVVVLSAADDPPGAASADCLELANPRPSF